MCEFDIQGQPCHVEPHFITMHKGNNLISRQQLFET